MANPLFIILASKNLFISTLIRFVPDSRKEKLSYKKIGERLGISGAYAHVLDKPDMYKTDEKKTKLKEYKDKAKEHNLEYGKNGGIATPII